MTYAVTPRPFLQYRFTAENMAMDGLVIQNAYRSVVSAGMWAHGVASNAYGTATLQEPAMQDLSTDLQSLGVTHGACAGMNLLMSTIVNSLA